MKTWLLNLQYKSCYWLAWTRACFQLSISRRSRKLRSQLTAQRRKRNAKLRRSRAMTAFMKIPSNGGGQNISNFKRVRKNCFVCLPGCLTISVTIGCFSEAENWRRKNQNGITRKQWDVFAFDSRIERNYFTFQWIILLRKETEHMNSCSSVNYSKCFSKI